MPTKQLPTLPGRPYRAFLPLVAGSVLAYMGLLAAMHFRSVASEPGRWLDGLRGYWRFLDRKPSSNFIKSSGGTSPSS